MLTPKGKSYRVLVDNCVRSDAEVAKVISVSLPNMFNSLALLEARGKNQAPWHQHEIECLPMIARLAKEGQLSLFINDAIREETWRKPKGFPYTGLGDIFHSLKFQHCPAAVNRHVFFQSEAEKDLVEFCEWLVQDYDDRWLEAPYIERSLGAHDLANLRNISRYREICSRLSTKHYDDAFHVWGGEANGIEYFLTTNINFVRALRQNKSLKLLCKPILPSELLKSLPAVDLEPMPFEYGRR